MTKDKVLKLGLEALEGFIPYLPLKDEAQCNRYDKAIAAVKEALEQPEQEPQIAINPETVGYVAPQRTWAGLTEEDLKVLSAEWRIVYGAWMDDFARDIETKLKEKNT